MVTLSIYYRLGHLIKKPLTYFLLFTIIILVGRQVAFCQDDEDPFNPQNSFLDARINLYKIKIRQINEDGRKTDYRKIYTYDEDNLPIEILTQTWNGKNFNSSTKTIIEWKGSALHEVKEYILKKNGSKILRYKTKCCGGPSDWESWCYDVPGMDVCYGYRIGPWYMSCYSSLPETTGFEFNSRGLVSVVSTYNTCEDPQPVLSTQSVIEYNSLGQIISTAFWSSDSVCKNFSLRETHNFHYDFHHNNTDFFILDYDEKDRLVERRNPDRDEKYLFYYDDLSLLDPVDLEQNPILIENNEVTHSYENLASAPLSLSREGVAADGISKLIIRLATSAVDTVKFEILEPESSGSLSNIENSQQSNDSIKVIAQYTNHGYFAFAKYQSPETFGNSFADSIQRSISIQISNKSTRQDTTIKIIIRRPPVVFVHGLWSDGSTWSNFLNVVNLKYFTYAVSYPGSTFFQQNRNVVADAIDDAIKGYKASFNLAATKCDVVAHSMGGMLTRYYLSMGTDHKPYRTADNFNQGDIRKFITIGTPHIGSMWPNNLFQYRHRYLQFLNYSSLSLEEVMRKYDHPLDDGALFDLAVPMDNYSLNGTHAINSSIDNPCKVHAIISKYDLPGGQTPEGFWGTVKGILDFYGVSDMQEVSDGDFVVSLKSQLGGLAPNSTASYFTGIMHISETQSTNIINRVQMLLEMPSESIVFADQFLPLTPPSLAKANSIKPKNHTLNSVLAENPETYVDLISPQNGVVFSPNQSVSIEAQSQGDNLLSKVLFFTRDTSFVDDAPPFQCSFIIPNDVIGNYLIGAIGKDNTDILTYDEVQIKIETQLLPDSIKANPDLINFGNLNQEVKFNVIGFYSDGGIRKIDEDGIIYHSSGESIALINEEGLMRAVSDGSTRILATYLGRYCSADVCVDLDPSYSSPKISCDQTRIYFDTIALGMEKSKSFKIYNSGNAPLVIESANIQSSQYNLIEQLPVQVSVDDSIVLHVKYKPDAPDIHFSEIIFYCNDLENNTYTIDLAGGCEIISNIINGSIKIYLQGPYDSNLHQMKNSMQDLNILPKVSPYTEDIKTVDSFPPNTVDWILVQLRDSIEGYIIYSQSALLNTNGQIMNADQYGSQFSFNVPNGDYYLVIKHRNHLPVMSNLPCHIESGIIFNYDFSTSPGKEYGFKCSQLEEGIWGLWGCDENRDGVLNTKDYVKWYSSNWQDENGYLPTDFNLDGLITLEDYNLWYTNTKQSTISTLR